YLQEDLFLAQKIPLPPLSEQNRIVEAYNKRIKQAEENEQKAKELEEVIEDTLFRTLGLEKVTIKQFKKGVINLFSFSSAFDRWDMHKDSSASLTSLNQAKYPIITLNEAFNFEKRGWKKNEHDSNYFDYIELGAVDPLNGITESKKIAVKKAPSRATQIIKTGDLIIGTTRPYLKRFAIVTEQFDENIASSGFQVISPSESYNLEFLLEYLKSDYGIKQFEFFMTGALYPAITSKDLKKIRIPIPPISIQNEIAKRIKESKNKIHFLNQNSQVLKSTAIKEFENEIFEKCN
ncbi:MAG: type restriction enzyme subunit, partial [Bacteroidales bacterium]|nr:type restriction enzyme subunit [Bacteroidales bacterium]